MTYRLKILLVAAFATLFVTLAASLAGWSVRATERHLDQAELAHNLLSEHLQLSVRAYRLFKQLTDEILLGSAANQIVVRNKRSAIADSLDRIRRLELEQRAALGPDVAPGAVEDTDDLERQIDTIILDFEALLALPAGPKRSQLVNVILEERIDIGFREAVNAALERQRNVVTKMNDRVATVHAQLLGFSVGLAMLALLGSVTAGWLLVRGLARPLSALQVAAESLGRGELGHRIPRGFDAEFDQIAETFNGMAAQIAEQAQSREDARRALELAVAERTSELSAANAALQRADAVRRHFFADVSHELRTPLTVIRGEAQVALRGEHRAAGEYRQALQAVLDQAVGLSRLVDDMLFIARADAESIRLSRRPLDIGLLTDEVCRDLARLGEQRDVSLIPEVSPAKQAWVADPDRIKQLMLILLDNAIRFSPGGAAVRICWLQTDGHRQLEVIDRGLGIDSQDLPHVFDRFFRGHGGHEDGQGLGLGLAVAKAIVAAHGGDIRAESAPGEGTRIVARFPEAST